ncbi:MAG: MFS transporter [Chloroflexi bacterium]|nr:MFS transporter [Chloroflexota bacterium]MDA1145993.1 MFS transporter [Chloroflexota bacterium]
MAREETTAFTIRNLVLTVYLPTIFMGIGQSAVLAFVVLQARDLGASVGVAGLVFAMRGLGVMAFDVPAGVLLGRLGQRRTMILSISLIGSLAAATAFSPNPWILAASVFALGGATSLWMLTRIAFVSEQAPVHQRGRALSLVGGSQRMGNFVGPVIGGFLAEFGGYSSAMLLQTAGAAIALIPILLFVTEARGAVAGRSAARTGQSGVLQLLRSERHTFLTAGLAVLALQVLRQGRQVLLPLWGDELDLTPSQIGLIIGFASSVDMLLFYPVGIVMDRFGRKWSAVPSMILLASSLALIPLTDRFEALLVVGLISGFANGLGSGIGMTFGADFAPPGMRGEFLGVWRFVTDIGTSAGPLLVAAVAAQAGLAVACIATGGVGLGGAAVMAFLAHETLHRSHPAAALDPAVARDPTPGPAPPRSAP